MYLKKTKWGSGIYMYVLLTEEAATNTDPGKQ